MAGEIEQLVQDVKVEGNFDVSDAQVLRWLTRRHRKIVVRSRCFRKIVEIGPTVADQQSYAVPAGLVDLYELTVNGSLYGNMTHPDIANGAAGFLVVSGDGGVMAGTEDLSGLESIALYPIPRESNLPIMARGAWRPDDLDTSDDTTLKIPPEFADDLVAGAVATGLERTEQRPDLAAPFNQVFGQACEELRRQVMRRYRGQGPATIKIKGYDC